MALLLTKPFDNLLFLVFAGGKKICPRVLFCYSYLLPCNIFSFFQLTHILMPYVIIATTFKNYSNILLLGVVELYSPDHFEVM